MFVSEKLSALFKKGTLKLVEDEEGEYRRVAEATLVIEPFTSALAHELGEEIAGHLFDGDAIRPELEAIDVRVRIGTQIVHVSRHSDLKPVARLEPVAIKDVSVERKEDKKTGRSWLALSFVLVFPLESRDARNFVIDEFGKVLHWTFMAQQLQLLPSKKAERAAAQPSTH